MSEYVHILLGYDVYTKVLLDDNFDNSMKTLMSELKEYQILTVIDNNKDYVKYVPKKLMEDKSFLIKCLNINISIHDFPKFIFDSQEFMLRVFKSFNSFRKPLNEYQEAFNLCSDKLKNNLMFIMQAVTVTSKIYSCLNEEFKNNKSIKLNVAKHGNLDDFPSEWLNDRSFVMDLCSLNGEIIRFLPEEFKNDKEIAQIALSKDIVAFSYLPEKLQNDIDLLTYFCVFYLDLLDYDEDDLKYYNSKVELLETLILKEDMKKDAVVLKKKSYLNKF